MIETRKPISYWTIDKCDFFAKQCKTRSEFQKIFSNAYIISRRLGYLDEICSHMVKTGNLKKRLIYLYEFPDNICYIGLTYNFNVRNGRHLDLNNKKLSPVAKHIIKTNTYPVSKLLTDYLPIEEAQLKEKQYIIEYKNNGWNLLNQSKGGEIGSNKLTITFEMCRNKALQFEYKKDFRKNVNKYYNAAIRNGWIDEISKHMIKLKIMWTEEMCIEKSKEFDSIHEFSNKYSSACRAARKLGIYNEITKHMYKARQGNNTLDYDYCKKISLNYKTRRELFLGNESAYLKSRENGWLVEFFLENKYRPYGFWNRENCIIECKKYSSRYELRANDKSLYTILIKNNWLDEFFPKQIQN